MNLCFAVDEEAIALIDDLIENDTEEGRYASVATEDTLALSVSAPVGSQTNDVWSGVSTL